MRLLSWNVLLPNSIDGWWIYKYYANDTPDSHWSARQDLIKRLLLRANADVLCLQETSERSFAHDFAFLHDAGYACAIMPKGRMRPATFWRRDRFELCCANGDSPSSAAAVDEELPNASAAAVDALDAVTRESRAALAGGACVLYGDRTLTTALRPIGSAEPPIFIVNVHLSAGQEARRRLRQVHEALDTIRKRAKITVAKAQDPPTKPPAVAVCGDFNSQGASAVRELLVAGEVHPDFRESGDPTEPLASTVEVTSKAKKHTFGPFADAVLEGGASLREPPPTIIAADLMSTMVHHSGEGPSEVLSAALDRMFDALSNDKAALTSEEEQQWLQTINHATDRGSEMRSARAARDARGEIARLTREDFHSVYAEELRQGKFWGIEHDLRAVTGDGLASPSKPPFTARFDYVYYTTGSLQLAEVVPLVSEAQYESLLREGGEILPNSWMPSDHLPVCVELKRPL